MQHKTQYVRINCVTKNFALKHLLDTKTKHLDKATA